MLISVRGGMFEEMLVAPEPLSSLDRPVMAEMYRYVVTGAEDWRTFLDQHIQLLDVDITMGNKNSTEKEGEKDNFVHICSLLKVCHFRTLG